MKSTNPGTVLSYRELKVTQVTHYGNWIAALIGSISKLENEAYILVYDNSKNELLAKPIMMQGYRGTHYIDQSSKLWSNEIRLHLLKDLMALQYPDGQPKTRYDNH